MNKICVFCCVFLLFASCASQGPLPITSGLDLNFQKEPIPNSKNPQTEIKKEDSESFSNDQEQKDVSEVLLETEVEKRISLQEENMRQLNDRLQEIEKILAEKEQEISILKQQNTQNSTLALDQQKQPEQSPQETDSSLVTQAIETDFGNSFRINNRLLDSENEKDKKANNEEAGVGQDSIYEQIAAIKKAEEIQTSSVSQQVLAIPLEQIRPVFLLNPPENPIQLVNLAGGSSFYKIAYNSFTKQNYSQAIKEFHNYIEKFPQDTAVDNSFFWIGVSYWHQNKPEIAQRYFAYILQNFAFTSTNQGGKTADAMVMLGRINKESQPSDSKEYYQKVLELYPNSNVAKTAQKLLAEIP